MKNKDNYFDFRDWRIILAYLKGIAIETLAALFLCAIGLLLAVAGHLLRR
jgi:hypothetical protein